ncbi:MAG: tRNA pseudouridine(55) synthase TruB [Nitrospirae bacterium]|nr:tRNA pseudouridine(55) synthase TruB [Nitrospirota bacterium]
MDCVINLNKPRGITSQEAVTRVKKALGVKKAGHAGTLDPIAEGVLLILINEATKIAEFLFDMDKEYIATLKLGERTDTFDSDGRVIEKKECLSIKMDDISRVIETMKGTLKQVPPMYSALKHKGKPLYSLARKGIEIERSERTVNIYRLDIKRFNSPYLELSIACSKGTYIRSLAEGIGNSLGVGAHITELKRVRIGEFKVSDSVSLKEIGNEAVCFTLDSALSHLREVVLSEKDFSYARNGRPIALKEPQLLPEKKTFLRLKSPDGKLFAVGVLQRDVEGTVPLIKIQKQLHLSKS